IDVRVRSAPAEDVRSRELELTKLILMTAALDRLQPCPADLESRGELVALVPLCVDLPVELLDLRLQPGLLVSEWARPPVADRHDCHVDGSWARQEDRPADRD